MVLLAWNEHPIPGTSIKQTFFQHRLLYLLLCSMLLSWGLNFVDVNVLRKSQKFIIIMVGTFLVNSWNLTPTK